MMLNTFFLFVVVGCTLGDYHGSHWEKKYHGPPAPLNHDGTVAETPEVKHAKAEHFAALNHAKSHASYDDHSYNHHSDDDHSDDGHYNHDDGHYSHDGGHSDDGHYSHDGGHSDDGHYSHDDDGHYSHNDDHSYDDGSYSHGEHKKHYEPAPLNHDGTVADTDDVKHAKAIFFKAYGEAKSHGHHDGDHHYNHHDDHHDHDYSHHEKKYHGPPAPLNHDGTVAETPEVKKAKSHHFHLYDQALHRHKRAIKFQPAPLNADGTVAETPEVQQAKAIFFEALAAGIAGADHSWVEPKYEEPNYNNYVEPVQNLLVNKHYQQPKHHSLAHYSTQPEHQPARHYSSAPIPQPLFTQQHHHPKIAYPHLIHVSNTPAQPSFNQYHSSHHYNHKVQEEPIHDHYSQAKVIPAPLNTDGTVADTPEIQQAKAIHFAAYQEAFARAIPPKHQYQQQQQPQY